MDVQNDTLKWALLAGAMIPLAVLLIVVCLGTLRFVKPGLPFVKLVLKNIRGSGFRNVAILLAVMGVAGFLLATALLITGVQYSLDSGLKRLGADILVVPAGAETKVETALLMGKPTEVWMPKENVQKVAAIPGVETVSPQIFLASMFDSPCCSVS